MNQAASYAVDRFLVLCGGQFGQGGLAKFLVAEYSFLSVQFRLGSFISLPSGDRGPEQVGVEAGHLVVGERWS